MDGSCLGLAGVTINIATECTTLDQRTTTAPLMTTKTDEFGQYMFRGVPMEHGLVVASHDKWLLSDNVVQFDKTDGDEVVRCDDFKILGFAVEGTVTDSNGNCLASACVMLCQEMQHKRRMSHKQKFWLHFYSKVGISLQDIRICGLEDVKKLCIVKTNKEGKFVFPMVPNGIFRIVSFLQDTDPVLEAQEIIIQVQNDSLVIKSPLIIA